MDLQDKMKEQLEDTFGGKFHKVENSSESGNSAEPEMEMTFNPDLYNEDGEQVEKKSGNKNKDDKTVSFIRKSLGNFTVDHESLIGVDISPHYIRVCQMKHAYERWSLKSLASACIEGKYTIQDIQNEENLYVENLREILKKNNIKTKDVVLSIPESSSIIKVVSIQEMPQEDFDQACALGSIWESMVDIPGSISDYCVFYQTLRRSSRGEKTGQPKIMVEEEVVEDIQPSAEYIADGSEVPVAEEIISGEMPADENAPDAMAESVPADEVVSEVVEDLSQNIETIPEDMPSEGDVVEANTQEMLAEAIVEDVPAEDAVVENTDGAEATSDIDMQVDGEIIDGVAEEEVVQPEEEPVGLMDVLFVAARISDIELYSNIARQAGLNPRVIDIRCLALKHAYDTDPESKKKGDTPVAFVEFGCDENYVMIAQGDDVYTYRINITDEDRFLMIGEIEEEETFRNFIRKFAEELNKHLTNHEEAYETAKIRDIYVTSSTPLHVNDASSLTMISIFIDEMKQRVENRNVKTCDFCNHIKVPEKFAKQVNAEGNLAAWAVTLGLATEKFDAFDNNTIEHPGVDNVNLLPNVLQIKKSEKTRVVAALGMFAFFVNSILGMSTSYAMLSNKSYRLSNEIDVLKVSKVEEDYNAKKAEVARLSLMVTKMSSLTDIRTSLPSNQTQLLTAYKHINKSIPEGVWLTDVDFVFPLVLKVEGKAIGDQNIIEFVKALDDGKIFSDISIKNMEAEKENPNAKSTEISSKVTVKEFVLQGILLENAAMQKLQLLSGEMSDGR